MRPGKAWKNTGSTRDLLNHGGPGKGDKDRTTNLKMLRANWSKIRGLGQKTKSFFKNYGCPTGRGGKRGRPDRVAIDRSKKAWRQYEKEYHMLQRDCDKINHQAGVDSNGYPLDS